MHITSNICFFYAYALVCSWHNWKQTISLRKRLIIIFSISLISMLKVSTNCYPKPLYQLPQVGKKNPLSIPGKVGKKQTAWAMRKLENIYHK